MNQSLLPKKKAERSGGGNWLGHNGEGRRFRFDVLDTLPNWYEWLLRSYAGLSQEILLDTAERWIVDAWGWDQSAVERAQDLPLRFRHGSWTLTQHRHGTEPTVERLNTHLEWHAMWCTAGELLKSVPLAEAEPDDWDDLASRVRRNQLSDPPLWPADLLVPTPLHVRHWVLGDSPLEDWVASITEADHRVALLAPEHAGYVVVASHEQTIVGDRSQTVHVSSALVEPSTASALLRALQSMDDSWDYKLPEEGEDQFEFCEPPYKLLGWLHSLHRDQDIDGKDPYNGHARYIEVLPGQRVCSACGLVRDASGAPRWSRSADAEPMFVFEVWGEGDDDDKSFFERKSTGYRLLAHRAQLQGFLCCEALDVIAEVEVTRRGHKTKSRFGSEDTETPKGKSDRVYRLDEQGGLYLAEGHHGTWAGAGPQPATGCQGRDA